MYHASIPSWAGGSLPHSVVLGLKPLVYGHFAVAVFIILSGYCLMLPVARSSERQLRGGFSDYIRRRARRILPPYYAALLVTLTLIKLIPQLQRVRNNYWDAALPAFRPDVLLSHFMLVHNLTERWYFKIDPPLWSVATEWQIYFLFPLLLLPLWRRLGLTTAVTGAILLGFAAHFLLPSAYNIDSAVPWYLGLFAMGMGAAVINFSPEIHYAAIRDRMPWKNLAAIQFVLVLAFALGKAKWWWANLWFADTQVGMFAACFLIYCTQQARREGATPLLRMFQARGVVFLGTMSYSLYLMHAPVLTLLHIPLSSMPLTPTLRTGIMLIVCVPLTVVLTYLFHIAFERKYMSAHKSEQDRTSARAG
jgi:peptidoglycan/LPS O-acetylase OafA/YrhL